MYASALQQRDEKDIVCEIDVCCFVKDNVKGNHSQAVTRCMSVSLWCAQVSLDIKICTKILLSII